MNTQKFQSISNYIVTKATKGQFSVDTAKKLENGQIFLRDNTEFVRKEISAAPSGTIKLVDSNTLKLAGISSFDKNKLEKYINHVITHIRIAYANDAASGKEASLVYKNDQTTVPAGLRNANLLISQSGVLITKIPVMDVIVPANHSDSAFVALSSFTLLKEETPFFIELEFPDGVSLGADKHYVEVALKGMATFNK